MVGVNNPMTNHIRTIVDEVVRELPYRSDILRKICYINSHHFSYVGYNTRVYFDESDLINNIPLIKNAYYTTTPATGITNRFIDILESGEYNVLGRRLASIESTEPEVVNVDMERVVIPQLDDILESGEYNEFGRRVVPIEPTEPEVVNVDMEHVVIPQPDDSFTIENIDDETLYLYRIGINQ
jgi:hypothetical protein